MIKATISTLAGFFGVIRDLLRRGERKADEDRGRLQEAERQRKAADATRKRMDDVPRTGLDEQLKRMRRGGW